MPAKKKAKSKALASLSKSETLRAAELEEIELNRGDKPTDRKWKEMQPFKSFVVTDNENKNHTFYKLDTVRILPHKFDPNVSHKLESYWVARIKDIRGEVYEDGSNSVWVQVQWFYSAKDVRDVVKSFDPTHTGKFERIFSDHYDFIEPEAFDAVIPLYKLSLSDPLQSYVPSSQFFRRYTLEKSKRLITPKPGSSCFSTSSGTSSRSKSTSSRGRSKSRSITGERDDGPRCLFKKEYAPNERDHEQVMHFCPRKGCCKAWHWGCLVRGGFVEEFEDASDSQSSSGGEDGDGSADEEGDADNMDVDVMEKKTLKKPTIPKNKASNGRQNEEQEVRIAKRSTGGMARKQVTPGRLGLAALHSPSLARTTRTTRTSSQAQGRVTRTSSSSSTVVDGKSPSSPKVRAPPRKTRSQKEKEEAEEEQEALGILLDHDQDSDSSSGSGEDDVGQNSDDEDHDGDEGPSGSKRVLRKRAPVKTSTKATKVTKASKVLQLSKAKRGKPSELTSELLTKRALRLLASSPETDTEVDLLGLVSGRGFASASSGADVPRGPKPQSAGGMKREEDAMDIDSDEEDQYGVDEDDKQEDSEDEDAYAEEDDDEPPRKRLRSRTGPGKGAAAAVLKRRSGRLGQTQTQGSSSQPNTRYSQKSKSNIKVTPSSKLPNLTSRPKSTLKSSSSKDKALLLKTLSSLPVNLLQIATQPLVRGGAFFAGGVAGNVGLVVKARGVVWRVLSAVGVANREREKGGDEDTEKENKDVEPKKRGRGRPRKNPVDQGDKLKEKEKEKRRENEREKRASEALLNWEEDVFGEDRYETGVGMINAVVVIRREGSTAPGASKGRGGVVGKAVKKPKDKRMVKQEDESDEEEEGGQETMNSGGEELEIPNFVCPNCGGAI